ESFGNFYEIIRAFDEKFGPETVQPRNAALPVFGIGRKILLADPVVDARAERPPHGRDDQIAFFQFRNILAGFDDAPEVLVSENEKFRAFGRDAVFGVVYLPVGSARSGAQN